VAPLDYRIREGETLVAGEKGDERETNEADENGKGGENPDSEIFMKGFE